MNEPLLGEFSPFCRFILCLVLSHFDNIQTFYKREKQLLAEASASADTFSVTAAPFVICRSAIMTQQNNKTQLIVRPRHCLFSAAVNQTSQRVFLLQILSLCVCKSLFGLWSPDSDLKGLCVCAHFLPQVLVVSFAAGYYIVIIVTTWSSHESTYFASWTGTIINQSPKNNNVDNGLNKWAAHEAPVFLRMWSLCLESKQWFKDDRGGIAIATFTSLFQSSEQHFFS